MIPFGFAVVPLVYMRNSRSSLSMGSHGHDSGSSETSLSRSCHQWARPSCIDTSPPVRRRTPERLTPGAAAIDGAVDAVEAAVQLPAEVPLRVRRLPLVELGKGLEPGDALAALALPEVLERNVVDVGVRVRLGREVLGRWIGPLLEEHRLDRVVARPCCQPRPPLSGFEVVRIVREHFGAVLRAEDDVL